MSPVIEAMALSTSVSLERTLMRVRVSSVPVAVWRSLFAIGASLTHVTVIVPVAMFDVSGPKVSSAR